MSVIFADEVDWAEQEEHLRARFGDSVVLFHPNAVYDGSSRVAEPTRASRLAIPAPTASRRPTIGHRPAPDVRPRVLTDVERIAASWDSPSGARRYRILDGPISAEAGHAAEATLTFVSADLGIARPYLLWLAVQPTKSRSDGPSFRERDMWGIAGRHEHAIGVVASLRPSLVTQVVGHECLHLTQPSGLAEDAEEIPAYSYGHKVRELLSVRIGGREHVANVLKSVRPPGPSISARLGDVLIAPDEYGRTSVWRNVGHPWPEWNHLGVLGS